ncbi:MAG: hypothetical protein MPF33_01545 [Candidatus Aramenus sp.]|jgi:hypothetical protein|nr:hypothetical protein [Candidatus Aramenus sp.]
MKGVNPIFYYFLFFDSTVIFPVIVNGLRVLGLWYSPLADTGQQTFAYPFIAFSVSSIFASVVLGLFLYRRKGSRFILVRGPMGIRSVLKAMFRDRVGRVLILVYSISYLISFLVVSGLLLIPGINVDSYFVKLTAITYEGSGINVVSVGNVQLVENWAMIALGVLVDAFLTFSMILSYYFVSLVYVSLNLYRFPVPRSFRLQAGSAVGGFLTASVPSIGTIAGICCLTPTAINSLLYLSSATLPLAKGLTWKYGTFVLGAWTGGVLQALTLLSPVIVGVAISSVSAYYIYLVSKRVNEAMMGEQVTR